MPVAPGSYKHSTSSFIVTVVFRFVVLASRRHQVPSEAQLRQNIPRGPGGPKAVRVQGVLETRAQQVAPLPDALLAGPQVLGLRRGVQSHRHAEDAREEAPPDRHTPLLLRHPGQRVAPRHRPVSGGPAALGGPVAAASVVAAAPAARRPLRVTPAGARIVTITT